jgi:transcriptional regulator with XRE-family HTH domain
MLCTGKKTFAHHLASRGCDEGGNQSDTCTKPREACSMRTMSALPGCAVPLTSIVKCEREQPKTFAHSSWVRSGCFATNCWNRVCMSDVVEHFDGKVKSSCRYKRQEIVDTSVYKRGVMALRVKEFRKAKGMSQEQLAAKAGVSRSQLSEIETEAKPANTLRLGSIARALGVEVHELFAGPTSEGEQALVADLMRGMSPEDRKALIHYARALAKSRD